MSLASDERLKRIEEAIEAEQLAPENSILIGYVLATEWASSDGETYMVQSHPEVQAYWRSIGLIEAVRMSIDHDIEIVNRRRNEEQEEDE